eukprot:SM000125S26072  [mRNA]  locus=s125:171758:179545:- [translate_table: standard]
MAKDRARALRLRGRVVLHEVRDALAGGGGGGGGGGAELDGLSGLHSSPLSDGGGLRLDGGGGAALDPPNGAWLDDEAVHASLSACAGLLAVARGGRVVISSTGASGDRTLDGTVAVDACSEGQSVTCLQWLAFTEDAHSRFLAVGTSGGALLVLTVQGGLLLRQVLHSGPLLRVRTRGKRPRLRAGNEPQDVAAFYATAVVRIEGHDLQTLVLRLAREHDQGASVLPDMPQQPGLRYHKWTLGRPFRQWRDGAITDLAPTPISKIGQGQFGLVLVGPDPTLASFRVAEGQVGLSTALIASKVATGVVSAAKGMTTAATAVYSLTRGLMKGDALSPVSPLQGLKDIRQAITMSAGLSTSGSPNLQGKPVELDHGRESVQAKPHAALQDGDRQALALFVAPRGPLMAIADSLGRVLLYDLSADIVVRMWKGYRAAQCAFLELPAALPAGNKKPDEGAYESPQAASENPNVGVDLRLCLAIYAPRNGILEVWCLRSGPRIVRLRCGSGCRLLQPCPSLDLRASSVPEPKPAMRARVYLLLGSSGQLFEVASTGLLGLERTLERQTSRGSSSLTGGIITEADVFQWLFDILHDKPGALLAAQAGLAQLRLWPPSSPEDKHMLHQYSKHEALEGSQEENAIFLLLGALTSAQRQFQIFVLLLALRPALPTWLHLAALRVCLDSTTEALEAAKRSGGADAEGAPSINSIPAAQPTESRVGAHWKGLSPSQKAVAASLLSSASVTGLRLRKRLATTLGVAALAQGTSEAETPVIIGSDVTSSSWKTDGAAPPKEAVKLTKREKLEQRLHLLQWHEHLFSAFCSLQEKASPAVQHQSSTDQSYQSGHKLPVLQAGTAAEVFSGDEDGTPLGALDLAADIQASLVAEGDKKGQLEDDLLLSMHMTWKDFLSEFACDLSCSPGVQRGSLRLACCQGVVGINGMAAIARALALTRPASHGAMWRLSTGAPAPAAALGLLLFQPLLDNQAVSRVNETTALLPLPRLDWQLLFVAWFGAASVPRMLAMDARRLFLLLQAVAAEDDSRTFKMLGLEEDVGEVSDVAADRDSVREGSHELGDPFPLCFHWCQHSNSVRQALVLARLCLCAVQKQFALRRALLDDQREVIESWRMLVGRLEEAWTLERAMALLRSHMRDAPAGPPSWLGREGPAVAELDAFPVAACAACLQLLLAGSSSSGGAASAAMPVQAAKTVPRRSKIVRLSSSSGLPSLAPDDSLESRPSEGEQLEDASEHDSPAALLQSLAGHFASSCQPDILAAHRVAEACRQWSQGLKAGGASAANRCTASWEQDLLSMQENLSRVTLVALKGGVVASLWASHVGPRAAIVVSLLHTLGRSPSNTECSASLGLSREAAVALVGGCEQLLVMLYHCVSMLDEADVQVEATVAAADAACRDYISQFRLRPPPDSLIHEYMLLLRIAGVALALNLQDVELASLFSRRLVTTFPALFQDLRLDDNRVEAPTEQMDARTAFLLAVHHSQQAATTVGMVLPPSVRQYAFVSIHGLASDLGVGPDFLEFNFSH